MAQITVRSDDGRLVHREWVAAVQADCDHFLDCLAERMRWAVRDAERGLAAGESARAEMPIAAQEWEQVEPEAMPVGTEELSLRVPALVG